MRTDRDLDHRTQLELGTKEIRTMNLTPEEQAKQDRGEVVFLDIRRRPLGERPLFPGDPDYPKVDRLADSADDLVGQAIEDQPAPIHNSQPASWPLVIKDMEDRHQVGIARYGTPLQPFNGRDSLVDAYQEGLDLVVYLRTRIAEEQSIAARLLKVADEWEAAAKLTEFPDEAWKLIHEGMVEEIRQIARGEG